MDTQQKALSKKKKSRFFETYISKVIKQVSEKNGITSNAKQQLNSVLCMIVKTISNTTRNLTEISKKKTLSDKEVLNALLIVLPGQLAQNSVQEGKKSVIRFKEYDSKGSSRQDKAGIIFPPSITEKFLRNFGYSKIMVTSSAPVCLAAVAEYIAAEILELASNSARDNKRIRITIRDLEMGVRNDPELNQFFIKENISFLGGGNTPFIHESLLSKKLRKKRIKTVTPSGSKKPHRFRPGTVAVREIRRFQKLSNCLTFAKFPFEKLVRHTVNSNSGLQEGVKISKEVFIILQYFIEQYVVNILHDSNFAAIHAGRVKLMPIDITLVTSIRNGTRNPYNNAINDVGDLLSVDGEDNEVVVGEDNDNEEVEEEY